MRTRQPSSDREFTTSANVHTFNASNSVLNVPQYGTTNILRRSPRKLSSSESNLTGHQQLACDAVLAELERCSFQEKTNCVQFYSYLQQKVVKLLHPIAKQWKVKISNRSKDELIARIMVHLFISLEQGDSFDELLRRNRACNDYRIWIQDCIQRCVTWSILPDVKALVQKIHPSERVSVAKKIGTLLSIGRQGKHAGTGSSNFTLNEFARLMVLVRDDDRCRHALMKACGSELSREESDARVTREAFWGMIACRFNDPLVDSKADFTGHLEEIDSNERPVVSRSASCLKDHFYSAKKAFTVVYNKWSASGQMDPSNIVAFLTVSSSGDYTMESKRTLITFLVCRVGTSQEETNLIQLTCKLIDNGRGGLDEGVDDENIAAICDSKAKKRKSTELQRNLDGMSHTLSDFTGYVKKRMDMLDAEKAQSETAQKRGMQYANEGEQEGILIDQILTGIERCKRAR